MLFKDLKVIELASVLAGPSVGMFFAELGAKVIKVESKFGDVTRSWKLKSENQSNSRSAYFSSVNWGKESIVLNLKEEADKQVVYDLVKDADIVICSYKPGDDKKLKMDYEALKAYNPKIIYGMITGFGEKENRVGYDAIVQAESGMMFINGEPENKPTKLPIAYVDLFAGHQLKEGILAALYHREKTGEGSKIAVSLIDAAITSLANQASNYLVAGHIPQRIGSEHPNIVPYGTVYQTKDEKYVVLAVGNDKQFEKLFSLLGLEQVPAFATNPDRVKNRTTVNSILENAISNVDSKSFIQNCIANHIPAGIVNDMQGVMTSFHGKQNIIEGKSMKGLRTVAFDAPFINKIDLEEPPELEN